MQNYENSSTQVVVESLPTTRIMTAPANEKPGSKTKELLDLDSQYATAGIPSLPAVLSRAEGAYLWDVEGKKYLDFLSAFSVVNQGHCHPRIMKTMIDQCQKMTLASHAYHNDQFPLLSKKLCDVRRVFKYHTKFDVLTYCIRCLVLRWSLP